MERKIGEIFEYNGEWYQCVEGYHCYDCDFRHENGSCIIDANYPESKMGNCNGDYRPDNQNVVFKKLEKVGETFERNGYMYQEYKAHTYPLLMSGGAKIPTDNGFAVIIKQKDMEENNNAKHSNSENIGKNLKPFDLEAAKSGKPVCTRDGRKARIICFDMNANSPIVALVDYNGQEVVVCCHNDGRNYHAETTYNDLMMLPEKKEGWVNIDKGDSGKIVISSPYSTKEEAIHNDNETTIDTIKISWEE